MSKLDDAPVEAANEAELQRKVVEKIDLFVTQHEHEWMKRASEREIAVFLHSSGPVKVESPYLLVVATQFAFYPLCGDPYSKQGYIFEP
jgi:hypothetical protein